MYVKNHFDAGKSICKEGEEGTSIFCILSGKVGVYKTLGNEQIKLREMGKNEVFGEMALLESDRSLRSATVIAITDCKILTIKKKALIKQGDDADVNQRILKAVINGLINRFHDKERDYFELLNGDKVMRFSHQVAAYGGLGKELQLQSLIEDIEDNFNLGKNNIKDALDQLLDYKLIELAKGVGNFSFEKSGAGQHSRLRIATEDLFLNEVRKKHLPEQTSGEVQNKKVSLGRVFTFVSKTIYQFLISQGEHRAGYTALAGFTKGVFTQIDHDKLRKICILLEKAEVIEFNPPQGRVTDISWKGLEINLKAIDRDDFEQKLADL